LTRISYREGNEGALGLHLVIPAGETCKLFTTLAVS